MAEKIVIASGKGGVGKSSATLCLARALAKRQKRVLVMDFDIGLRSLDLLFGISAEVVFDWGDVLTGRCDPKRAFLEPEENILFISAPLAMRDGFTQEHMRELLRILDRSFHFILMDAPAGLHHGFCLAAGAADIALLIATPDEVCVRSAAKTAKVLQEIGVERQRLIINRFYKRAVQQGKQLNIDEMIDGVSLQLLGVVPEDFSVPDYLCRGLPLPDNAPAKRAFTRIAGRMLGERIPLQLKSLY